MHGKKWLIGTAALFLVLLFLAWQAPAGWALKTAKTRNPDLSWAASGGSIWNGQASNVYWQGLALGTINWKLARLQPSLPLSTGWSVHGSSSQYTLDGQVWLSGGELTEIGKLEARVPAAWIDISHTVPFVYLTGTLAMDVADMTFAGGFPSGGDGNVLWSGAGLAGLVNESLGDIDIEVREDAEAMRFEIRTLSGEGIRINGDGWLREGRYDMRITLVVPPQREDIRDLLGPYGELLPDGSIRFQLNGKLFPGTS